MTQDCQTCLHSERAHTEEPCRQCLHDTTEFKGFTQYVAKGPRWP